MTSSFHPSAGDLRITLSGDLIGGAEAIKFSVDLRDRLSAATVQTLELDASQVGFVNSSGLGMLISARQAAIDHGAEFRMTGAGDQLRHLLEVTKLTDILGAA